jgi:hypothetical protein
MALYDFTEQFKSFVPPHVVPEGEYKIRIIEVKEDNDKNGNPYWLPKFEIVDDPTAKTFTCFIGLPSAGKDPRRSNDDMEYAMKFMAAFGAGDFSRTIDPQSWIGREGWAVLKIKADEQYGDQNAIKAFTTKR